MMDSSAESSNSKGTKGFSVNLAILDCNQAARHIEDTRGTRRLFNAVESIPRVTRKEKWALNWIRRGARLKEVYVGQPSWMPHIEVPEIAYYRFWLLICFAVFLVFRFLLLNLGWLLLVLAYPL
ncbi:hypothetical protein C5167_020278 [Papaver somniferum]|uniref:Uncharacterized protein n=1 Tax=Papaver somniferum TaxID=3469 RepID=A0A4Y7IVW6_PAPSO|nr:hypothetical protein C5167_020278 [Papaver somniferum]